MKKQLLVPFYIFFCIALIFFGIQDSFAQNESDERALIKVKNGISISKDSLFLLNLRFRMQNRFGFNTASGEDFEIERVDFRIRRLRLRLDGYVLNPRIQYYIQLGFSKADLDLESGDYAQPIRDAIVYYYLKPNFYIGFGQSKLPGNRERVVSSGNLQFADRSIANGFFTLDRDFGLFGYYTYQTKGSSQFQLKGAINTGEGRNPSAGDRGLSYTGRVEYLPFGSFKNNGDYSEGDLEFEDNPKLSIGMTYNWNENAHRTRGQLGSTLYEGRDMDVFIADAMFKYAGWGAMAEFFKRGANNPITNNEAGDTKAVFVGIGTNMHLSKMISRKSEFAFRYSSVRPDEEINELEKRLEETAIGYSRYLNGHRIKLQGNLGYAWTDGQMQLASTSNYWFATFQVEFGI
ncbi:porin [Algoriphagus aquimarinus]|uniref:porin n=1 Tax=Algoriphagus aquimarinus TaxID=237018 RepID=UPI0030DAE604|tara:strand:+ start:1038 stop:2252 length:1215 start_codon:yes stop_codon:yes gene_type:complete